MWMFGRLVSFMVVVVVGAGAAPAPAQVPAAQVPAAQVPADQVPAARYRWPLDGAPTVVRRFSPPPEPWLPGHRGVDLSTHPGVIVRSAGDGVVYFAGVVAGRGVVSVEHAGGLRTTYEPVAASVAAGARVDAGWALGTLAAGHPGCPAAACLHWGLRRGVVYLDPLGLIGPVRVRLLPLHPSQEGG
jgi:murein DD-endopeptidase MepM/ murein hydrolase activator NlpD